MNMWIITGLIVGLVIFAGIAIGNIVTADADQETNNLECSSCGNSCTAQSNCGLSSCGAVSGSGSCGCRG